MKINTQIETHQKVFFSYLLVLIEFIIIDVFVSKVGYHRSPFLFIYLFIFKYIIIKTFLVLL